MQNNFFLVTHRYSLAGSVNYKYIWIFSSKEQAVTVVNKKNQKKSDFKNIQKDF
jgi:hypothetical protein